MSDLVKKNDFKEVLTAKIKEEFIKLIPDDVLNNYIEESIKEFEEHEIKSLVKRVIREHAEKAIKNMLQTNSYGLWNYEKNMYELSPELEKMLIHATPKMFGEIMREVVRNTLTQMNNNMSIY